MHIKTGLDIVEDKRIEKNLANLSFLKRVFHPTELAYVQQAASKKEQAKKLAGIFALKEATAKALNLTPPRWLDIQVDHALQGKPNIEINNTIKKQMKIISIDASISHAKDLTIGIVILLAS